MKPFIFVLFLTTQLFSIQAQGVPGTAVNSMPSANNAPLINTIGVCRDPALAKMIDPPGSQTIAYEAGGSTPKAELERLPEIGVIQDWKGFDSKGLQTEPKLNQVDFRQGPDFQFRFDAAPTTYKNSAAGNSPSADGFATSGSSAIYLGSGKGFNSYEISAGLCDKGGRFLPDTSVYALGFVLTGRVAGSVAKVSFFNRAGQLLCTQTASGADDPVMVAKGNILGRGIAIYFGYKASSTYNENTWVNRVLIESLNQDGTWGMDDFAFAPCP